MKKIFFLVCFLAFALTSCKKSANEKDMVGIWVEKTISTKFTGTLHWIRFNADMTFEMKLNHFTDIADPEPVPCSGNRTDYVKGSYQMTDKHITFTGNYCDASFDQFQANCQGTESYQADYSVTFKGKDLIFDYEREDPYKIWLVKQ